MSDASPAAQAPVQPEPDVTDPAKLIRLGTMVQTMLAEVGDATQDEAGRIRLAAIHRETIEELQLILSEDLRQELAEFDQCVNCESPSAAELRVAQAQLVGWMQGLLRGMQASAQAQAQMAQQQLQMMQMQMAAQQMQAQGGGAPAPPQQAIPASATEGAAAAAGDEEMPGYL